MQYFIGIKAPQNYTNTILSIHKSLGLNTTEPHITIIPPNILPKDDIFIKDLICACENISPFELTISDIGQFDNRVIFFKATSDYLSDIKNKITQHLGLKSEKRSFVPHLTILKRKYMNPVNAEKVRKIVAIRHSKPQSFTVNSIIVYQQKKPNERFKPYMEIPLF